MSKEQEAGMQRNQEFLDSLMMGEIKRNERLLLLLQDLRLIEDWETIKMIGTLVAHDTPSMQMGYWIMTQNIIDKLGM